MSRLQARNRKIPGDRGASSASFKLAAGALKILLLVGILFSSWSAIRLEIWSQPGSISAQPAASIPWSNVNPVGVNTFLAGEVEVWKRERTLQMVAEAGAGWIRQVFAWNEIEPQQGEHWDARYQQDAWAKYDNIIDLAEQNGVRVIARLDQTPEWARPPGTDPATPPSNFEDYGDFVYDFVSRYRGRVSFIQIWNEPNLAREWGGSIDPAEYAELLEIAATRAREANPDIVILSAPMAMTTENSARATDEFTYWQALYDLDVGQWFDVMSANVYGLSSPYDAPPDATILNTRRVELLRDLALENDDGHKAIWFNEYGWNAAPSDFPSDDLTWSRVDESQQADWTAAGLDYAREQWDWFGVANIWYFRHVGNISPDQADYYFRMVDVEFTPRDVYRSVQAHSRTIEVAHPGWHGVLTAPVTSIGKWGVERRPAYQDGFAITGQAGSSLAIRFEGSALDLHLPAETASGTLTVTVYPGSQTVSGGSRPYLIELNGESGYINVLEEALQHPAGSQPGIRTAVITVNNESTLTVDGIRVRYERSYANLFAGAALAGLGGVGLIGLRRSQTGRT